MSNRPNRAHTEAPVMSFEQQVAQVLDSLTKELTMSEPPAGPLDAANEYAARHGHPFTTLRQALETTTTPFLAAVDRYRADMQEARRLSATEEGCSDFVAEAEDRFRARAKAAIPFNHLREAVAAVEWVRADLAEGEDQRDRAAWSPFVLHRDRLLGAAADLLRNVTDADAAVFHSQGVTSRIPALGLTFREAADRVRELLTLADASHEHDEADEGSAADERVNWQAEASRLHDAIFAAPPATVADLSVKLERLTCSVMGVRAFEHPNFLQSLAGDVRRLALAGGQSNPGDAELLAAYDKVHRLRAWMDGPELGDRDVPSPDAAEHFRLIRVVAEAPAYTAAGLAAKLQMLADEVREWGSGPVGGVDLLSQFIRTALEGAQRLAAGGAGQQLETTSIPELGITFAEAAERYRSLRRAEVEANQRGDQRAADDANRQHCRLADQIMDAPSSTPADAIVILSMLADREMGIAAGIDDERAQRALERVYALLSTTGQRQAQPEESRSILESGASFGLAWNCLQMEKIWRATEGARKTTTEEAMHKRAELHARLILQTPSRNLADVVLQLAVAEDFVMRLSGTLEDVTKLGVEGANADVRQLYEFASDVEQFINGAAGILQKAAALDPRDYLPAFVTAGAETYPPIADAFDEAGAAFEALAPATLSMPLELTNRMIDAGASAAGITPDQFKAAVKAARDARAA